MVCKWGYGVCRAPDTICPHWIGTFCELDEAYYQEYGWEFDEFVKSKKEAKHGNQTQTDHTSNQTVYL